MHRKASGVLEVIDALGRCLGGLTAWLNLGRKPNSIAVLRNKEAVLHTNGPGTLPPSSHWCMRVHPTSLPWAESVRILAAYSEVQVVHPSGEAVSKDLGIMG